MYKPRKVADGQETPQRLGELREHGTDSTSEGTSADQALDFELLVPITVFFFFFSPALQGHAELP